MSALSDGLLETLKEQHALFRQAVEGVSAAGLNWRPAEGANSLAMLVTHSTEAEGRLLRLALEGEQRDAAEVVATRLKSFDAVAPSVEALVALLDAADAEATRAAPAVDRADLGAERTMRGSTMPAAEWMLRAVAHNGEHVGNALLTRQLWDGRAAGYGS